MFACRCKNRRKVKAKVLEEWLTLGSENPKDKGKK